MSSLFQNILIFVGLVGLVGFGYFLYSQNERLNLSAGDAATSNQIAIEASDFLRRLNDLKAITLDTEILNDPRFSSLVNYSAPLQTESVGRTNPFENN